MTSGVVWLSVALAAALSSPAVPATPFAANLAAEYTLSAAVLVATGVLNAAVKPSLSSSPSCRTLDHGGRCDPATLWALDRRSLHLQSRGWSIASDIGQGLSVGGSAVLVLADALLHHTGMPVHDAATDAAVLLESFALSTAINQLLKYTVRRPRPQMYRLGGRRGFEAQLSFPSGHTAATASALTAWSTIFWLRHPQSRWRFVPYMTTLLATGLVAYGRVAAPKHFATDTFAAALLGGAAGFCIPMLHQRWPERSLRVDMRVSTEGPSPAMGLLLAGTL